MTDPNQPRQPTQEELEAHLAQLREADAAEVVAQAVNMLATGAQVKLGRSDARVLIDAMAAIADAVEGEASDELVEQVRNAVSQLQMAQVQAEQEGAPAGEEGAPAGEAGAAGSGEAGGAAESGDQRMTDRLWIPGREPGGGQP